MTDYRVSLDAYSGPLDLLLYLIRRDEIDIYNIPIASITDQYLEYVDLVHTLDPEAVSEFLVLATTLMEIKSRTLLPRPPAEEEDGDIEDPRRELIRQLLEYKKFKDAAASLGEAAAERTLKHQHWPATAPDASDEIELENLEIWDLFDAFNRMLEQTGLRDRPHAVGVDDTPIKLHAADIVDSLERAGGTQTFEQIFTGRSKAEMIGLFLALLELIRAHRIRVTQDDPLGSILIHLLDATPIEQLDDRRLTPDPVRHDDEPNPSPLPSEETDDAARSQGSDDSASESADTARTTPEDQGEADDGEPSVPVDPPVGEMPACTSPPPTKEPDREAE